MFPSGSLYSYHSEDAFIESLHQRVFLYHSSMFLQDELYPPVETVLEMEPEELAPLVPLAGSG